MNACHLLSTHRFRERLETPEATRTRKLKPAISSPVQFARFAILFVATVLAVIVTMAFGGIQSASIFGAAPARAMAAFSRGKWLTYSSHTAAAKRVTSGDLSISLNGANPLKSECGESFSDPGATAMNSAGKRVPVQVSGKVDTTTLESYTLTYSAVDDQDSASVERIVNIVDTTPPEIILKGGKTTTVSCGESFVEPGASALDSCQGNVPVAISGSIDPNIQGRYTISYTAVDASNNTRVVTREVIVGSIEDNPPTIKLVGRAAMTIECGNSFIDPGATAITPCSGSVPVETSGSVDAHTPGSYIITYAASSGELKSETARTVTVVDSAAPVISLKGDNPLTISRHSIFMDPGGIAQDACAGEFAAAATSTVDPNTTGSYTITYTASDSSGNEATPVRRTVNVVDAIQTPPVQRLSLAEPFPLVGKLLGLKAYSAGSSFTTCSMFRISC